MAVFSTQHGGQLHRLLIHRLEVSGAGKAVLTNHKGNVGVVAGAFPPLLLNNTLSAKTLENLALQNFQGFKHQCSLTLHVPAQKASN